MIMRAEFVSIQIEVIRFFKNLHNINGTHEHAEYHMDDAKDDGQLHFVRIQEYNLVLGKHPNWIHTQRIRVLFVIIFSRVQFHKLINHDCFIVEPYVPTRPEYVYWSWEYVIIDDASVNGKQTHEKYNVTAGEKYIPNFVRCFFSHKLLLLHDHKQSEQSHNYT